MVCCSAAGGVCSAPAVAQKARQARPGLDPCCCTLLAFLPSSWASYTLHAFTGDNIFPALCSLFLPVWRGRRCEAVFYTRQQAPIWPWLLAAGVGLPAVT